MEPVKEYTNGEVTIVWKPKTCIHSEKCWRGLPEVFKPKEKPWIDAEGASTDEIVSQVKKCPSGALSYYMNNEENKKEMSKIEVTVLENGPLMVSGGCEITHKDGTKETKEKAAFCRCGHSANKPFCDGSHKAEDFKG
ncbi:(4Fe-4S)-binding protein [Fulvivirga lutea]|uniref:(4Fe-4S)-binding protein n=1 Tax=Fulvivirga lutea TaxID=2810512 RepID=A0A974WK47_9BACT|nr:(4Fe-4S)-binding protein [Fulvivirga lutea]QSE99278.1 (4Fe-4S)-binding protein [Fulvivirga lutea]